MTRDERKAAGWVECWGVRLLGRFPRYWTKASWCSHAVPRHDFGSYAASHTFALTVPREPDDGHLVATFRFWRRKKPKAPPPLAVGDREQFETHAVTYADHAAHMPSLGLIHKVRQSLQRRDGQPVRVILERP